MHVNFTMGMFLLRMAILYVAACVQKIEINAFKWQKLITQWRYIN